MRAVRGRYKSHLDQLKSRSNTILVTEDNLKVQVAINQTALWLRVIACGVSVLTHKKPL